MSESDRLITTTSFIKNDYQNPNYQAWLITAAIYLILYVGFFYSAALLDQGGFIGSLWYPPAGMTVFGMLAFGWIGVVFDSVGSILTLLLAAEWRHTPLSIEALLSGIILHPLAYGIVLLPLRRWIIQRGLLENPDQVFRFLLAVLLCTVVASSVGILRLFVLELVDVSRIQSIALTWLIGDFIGIIAFAPLLLIVILPLLKTHLFVEQKAKKWFIPKLDFSIIISFLILAIAPLSILSIPWIMGFNQFSPFITLVLLLPLAWMTLRGGLYYAVICIMILSSALVIGASIFDYNSHAFEYQLIMIAIALTGLLLGSVVEERNQARQALEVHASNLENQVAKQTSDLSAAYLEKTQSEHHLQMLIDVAPVGIAEFDKTGNCIYINSAACSLIAHTQEEAKGKFLTDFIHQEDSELLLNVMQMKPPGQGGSQLEFRLKNNDGWMSAHWINMADNKRSHIGSMLIFEDITERREKEKELWNHAHIDSLTQLYNRNFFNERLNQSMLRAQRNKQYVGLLWIDLDGFKEVNDHYGHPVGDELLQQVAQRLEHRMRAYDMVARMGGDEFAVILADLSEQDFAIQVADDLIKLLAQPYELENRCTSNISASIGVSFYPLHAIDMEHLIKYADIAMYNAKKAGKNQVHVYGNNNNKAYKTIIKGKEIQR